MFEYLFGTAGFMPHGVCLLWRPDIVVMHLGADILIFLAYATITLAIHRFVARRPEFRRHPIAWLSMAFIGGCGIAHLFGAVSLWWPAYGAQGMLKVAVALVSVAAAVAIWRAVPALANYPTLSEIEARRVAEMRLRAHEVELTEALEDLKVANETKANFLAAMSHDLRTPLNAILGFSGALTMGIFGALANARQTAYVEHIRSSGQQLLTLIDDLLDLSGVENRKRPLARTPIRACGFLEEIVEQFEVSSASQNRAVQVDLRCSVDTIFTSESSFRRILNNLLANAAKYGRGSGTISVELYESEDWVELVVTDDGPGFPVDNIDGMRAPFTRERATNDGIGIGLAIVDALMQRHGGEMILANTLRRGARITLRFPPAPPEYTLQSSFQLDSPVQPQRATFLGSVA